MSTSKRIPVLFLVVTTPLLAVGCGSSNKGEGDPETARKKYDLEQIHEAISMYVKSNQRPPKQVADLKKFERMLPAGSRLVEKGDYVVVWGVATGGSPETVLAYEKDAPKKGGMVLMADGSVKIMTTDELQAALKSKG
jgi:hypothetical protein